MITKRWIFIALTLGSCFLLSIVPTHAQEDMSVWLRSALKIDVGDKSRLSIEEEFRFFENASMMEQNHTEIGFGTDLASRLDGGVFYRFIYETDRDRGYSIGHRTWIQMEYQLIDQDVEVSLRSRMQNTFENVYSSENGTNPEWYSRNKLNMAYKPRKADWIPQASAEFWYRVGFPEGNFVDKYRLSFGLEYRPSKNFRWEFFYLYQKQIQVSNPSIEHVAGMSFTYLIRNN